MKNRTLQFGLALVAMTASACATVAPPQDLVSARNAYDRASKGVAAQLAPADVHNAKEALDAAESSFADSKDSQETKDLAYTATRRAELAEARARTNEAARQKDQTNANLTAAEKANAQQTTAQLSQAKTMLASQGQALQSERARREDAERRAAQAAADLAKFASVKQEARGMVITLSGAVLFETGKSQLMGTAQTKLNDVANALTKEDPDSKIVVEGHTDSVGAAQMNQDLSQRRAQSVRDYLVSRGISSDRISAQGFGPTRSIADNASPEGRANNRRVEIVVLPSGK